MENESISPEPQPSTLPAPVNRHDGWTGDKMAQFCEVLADTAVVAEACEQVRMGISGAYALRRRNAFFAAAWDAALTIARERLADTLLARSMEGNAEQIWRDGVLVGERHVLDNRLGLAILRRLDRLAETGTTISTRGERSINTVRPERSRGALAPAPIPATHSFDWEAMVDALRSGDPDAVAAALALLKGHEVEEVEGPPFSLIDDEEDPGIDYSDRCWKDPIEQIWMTDFPPPQGFAGYESCDFGDPEEKYERECTPEECAILDADATAILDAERAEDAEMRDTWFGLLKAGPPSAGE